MIDIHQARDVGGAGDCGSVVGDLATRGDGDQITPASNTRCARGIDNVG
jgi:hypothetical protein